MLYKTVECYYKKQNIKSITSKFINYSIHNNYSNGKNMTEDKIEDLSRQIICLRNRYVHYGYYIKNSSLKITFKDLDEKTSKLKNYTLNNKVYLIDELDSSLHPLLVNGLLKLFLESNKQNQLIITTHKLRILDFELVRRDEIWFTEKKETGNTKLYSLEEFKDVARFDRKIDRAYLDGGCN